MALGRVFSLFLLLVHSSAFSNQPFERTAKGVQLQGGLMEVVKERHCSEKLLRLTCRSFKALLIVLEAQYQKNRTDLCGHDLARTQKQGAQGQKVKNIKGSFEKKIVRRLRGNYLEEDDAELAAVDFRTSLNRRCAGLQHCRFNVVDHFPEAASLTSTNIQLKYACIPENAVYKYCNTIIDVVGGEGGYLKSPGYPSYYLGGETCGWTFRALPGQRISLTLHDLNIRTREQNGSCVDVVRIREGGTTLLETCDTMAGLRILSRANRVTLYLIAKFRIYPARGLLLQYQAVSCSDVSPPNGSYVSNTTINTRTFLCKKGFIFSDTKERSKTIKCKDGQWDKNVKLSPSCIVSHAAIQKAQEGGRQISSLSGSGDELLGGGRVDAIAEASGLNMDPKQPSMAVDVILPSVLMALLFVGNAIIVYVIFQYRKRKLPAIQGEEMALSTQSGLPEV